MSQSDGKGGQRTPIILDNHGAYPLAFHASQDPISGPVSSALSGNATHGVLPFDTTQITSKLNRSSPKAGDPCHPIPAQGHAPAVAYPINTLTLGGRPDPENDARMTMGVGDDGDPQFTISANHSHAVCQTVPRRLTPTECERLQGFPDNWTQVEHNGKPMADGPRYRMMGNAVTVNVVEWISRRIMEFSRPTLSGDR